jgi:hypothetical protein
LFFKYKNKFDALLLKHALKLKFASIVTRYYHSSKDRGKIGLKGCGFVAGSAICAYYLLNLCCGSVFRQPKLAIKLRYTSHFVQEMVKLNFTSFKKLEFVFAFTKYNVQRSFRFIFVLCYFCVLHFHYCLGYSATPKQLLD